MSSLFGPSASHSSSSSFSNNVNNPLITSAFTPFLNTAGTANGALSAMLGLGGDTQAQDDAFANWRKNTGYQFAFNQGLDAINGNAAAQGLLNSGATAKALNTYGQNFANTQYGNYTNQLQGLINNGFQGGQLIANTGQQSQSQSSSTGQGANGGIGNLVGNAVGAFLGK